VSLARTSRIRWLVGVAQGHLGLVLNAQGDHAGARMALLEAVASAQESGNQWDKAWGEVGLGDAELGLGNSGQASTRYCLGLKLATEEHALPIALEALAGLALLRAQVGDRESALELAGHVSLHPASSGNARARADQVRQMLNADSQDQFVGVAGTFEETVQRILAGISWLADFSSVKCSGVGSVESEVLRQVTTRYALTDASLTSASPCVAIEKLP
jgi:hypothetical protein